MNLPDDRELAVAYSQASEPEARAALGTLLIRHEATIRSAARRLCGGLEQDAEDLFQEFAVHLFGKRSHFVIGHAPWIAWAMAVLRGCASVFRRKRERYSRSESVGDAAYTWADRADSAMLNAWRTDMRKAFAECFQNVDAETGRAFYLKFCGEHTLSDIAELLGIGSVSSVSRMVSNARDQLRDCLSRKGFTPMDQ